MTEKITASHLQRPAVVYVRQSTPHQVCNNEESRRLQYAMKDRLHELGWSQIEIIDDDLGRTASGITHRPGFERMVTRVSLGEIGAVAAREVSRFARNNREWYPLLEICGIVNTLLIDHETIFDPRNSNDRLLLGLKGNLSAYELDQLRHRALEARRAKARRGELFMALPPGFIKTDDGRVEKDPDRRVQHTIELLFKKTLELGSGRQAALWFIEHGFDIPVQYHDGIRWQTVWRRPQCGMILRILRNPIYAGSDVYGRRHVVVQIENGMLKKSTRRWPEGAYEVLIPGHHEGYVSQEIFECVQHMLSNNASRMEGSQGPSKLGIGLLTGLLRCARCGRKLRVNYTGTPRLVRYTCDQAQMNSGTGTCIQFGGTAIDAAVSRELVRVLTPAAIEAAAEVAQQQSRREKTELESSRLEVEAARFEAARAQRQYDAVDPDNRLVAGELEARWNRALEKFNGLQKRLEEEIARSAACEPISSALLQTLAEDFGRVWNSEATDIRLKKRIARTLIEEIIADISPEGSMIELVIHWKGGVHTPLHVARRRRGQSMVATSADTLDAIRVLAHVCTDERIAQALNRSGAKTATELVWTRSRVKDVRRHHEIPVFDPERQRVEGWFKLGEAAMYLGVTSATVRKQVELGRVVALHPVSRGPWVLRRDDLDRPQVHQIFQQIRTRNNKPEIAISEKENPLFSTLG